MWIDLRGDARTLVCASALLAGAHAIRDARHSTKLCTAATPLQVCHLWSESERPAHRTLTSVRFGMSVADPLAIATITFRDSVDSASLAPDQTFVAGFQRVVLMKQAARGSNHGGVLVLPVETPYDCEVLLEELGTRARLRGQVNLELQRRRWRVSLSRSASASTCAACGKGIRGLVFSRGSLHCCGRCATADLRSATKERARLWFEGSAPLLTHPWLRAAC